LGRGEGGQRCGDVIFLVVICLIAIMPARAEAGTQSACCASEQLSTI
jgi:hypothetical protein